MDFILQNLKIYHTLLGLSTLALMDINGFPITTLLKELDEEKLNTLKLAIEYKAWLYMGINPSIMMFGKESIL